ncbi:uncharacterized protein [Prorops nasuta]|uniref:uncharacterized protein n=1 Tax=Prorops nasuta TaxID=863751 RepID=UPI0034CD5F3D
MKKPASDEECLCTETTQLTNIGSLQSEIESIINHSELKNVCLNIQDETTDKETAERPASTSCKCHEIFSLYFPTPSEAPGIPVSEEQSSPRQLPTTEPRTPKGPVVSDSCICRAHKIDSYTKSLPLDKDRETCKNPFWCIFNWKKSSRRECCEKSDVCGVRSKQECQGYEKSCGCSEMSEGKAGKQKLNKPKEKYEKRQSRHRDKDIPERIDIYYFDHGNSAYYQTTDSPPIVLTEKCAERTDNAATRFWAEIFGTIHIGTAFVTAFILQLLRFILYSICRPLTVGIVQLFGDYFLKPCLSILFNAVIQPVLILLYNIATSLRDLCEPLAEAIGLFLREIANVCRSIRIVEVKQGTAPPVRCCLEDSNEPRVSEDRSFSSCQRSCVQLYPISHCVCVYITAFWEWLCLSLSLSLSLSLYIYIYIYIYICLCLFSLLSFLCSRQSRKQFAEAQAERREKFSQYAPGAEPNIFPIFH